MLKPQKITSEWSNMIHLPWESGCSASSWGYIDYRTVALAIGGGDSPAVPGFRCAARVDACHLAELIPGWDPKRYEEMGSIRIKALNIGMGVGTQCQCLVPLLILLGMGLIMCVSYCQIATRWGPSFISWFINPINYIYIANEPQLTKL